MKKTLLILLCALTLVMCKAKKEAVAAPAKEAAGPVVQYKDDFRSVSATRKAALLKSMGATDKKYSILIFTKGYIGEKVVASNNQKLLYGGYLISNKKTGIADKVRIDNTLDTKVYDSSTKKEVILEAKETQKHKFIYVMKESGKANPFTITYSNTLRPLE